MDQTDFTEKISLLLPLLLLPLLFYILKNFNPSSKPSSLPPLPPGPYQWPIIGNILQIGQNPHRTLTKFAKTYGPLISLRLGTQIVIVGSTKEAALEILKTHDRILSGRYVPHVVPAKSLELNKFSIGWNMECNEEWRNLRALCKAELFSGKALEGQAVLREKKAMEMVEYVKGLEGKVVKIREVGFCVVFNMLSNILVSMDLVEFERKGIGRGLSEIIRELMEVSVVPNVSDLFPVLGRFDLQGLRKKSLELNEECAGLWGEIIKERREKNSSCENYEDFLDVLVGSGFSDDQINSLLMELLTAGTDTSSSTIEWTMAELIKNPTYMKKVQQELEREIKQDLPKETHLPRLHFLQACIKETLRLHPPAPFLLPHRSIESCEIMNYTIPKNSQILVNIWATARDPNYWDEPLVFKPERFLNSSLDYKGNDFELLPFGAGRRICPGLPMASKHTPLVLALLIRFFNWSLPLGQDPNELNMNESYGLTLLKEQPLFLIPKHNT